MGLKILGIAPGAVSGGCAIVMINDGTAPQLVDAIDLPTIGVKAKQRVDVLALRAWLQQHKPDRAVIERGQAMPKQGVRQAGSNLVAVAARSKRQSSCSKFR